MEDFFARSRKAFEIPEGLIYLDGNSLGALPIAVKARVAHEISAEWGQKLIRGWNVSGWMDLPLTVGNKIARLIGAPEGSVLVADSTSVNVFKVITAALAMAGSRRIILSDTGNFPTDLYMVEGAVRLLGQGHQLKLVEPEAVAAAIDENVAVLMLTQVDYRTGRLHDMAALTARAKAAGVVVIWDLAHSAGAFPVDLTGCGADFAVGCGYKYLNGGPGAPAFVYVRPGLSDAIRPALSGWLGHEAPFAFDTGYRPAAGIDRMRVGTPPVLGMTALDTALDIFASADMTLVHERSMQLSQRFIQEVETRCPQLRLASPRNPYQRGSQVSFHFAEGYGVMQALIAIGVIGDFRSPDIMRFGFTPLYLSEADVVEAAKRLERVIAGQLWRKPEFQKRSRVT